MQLSVVLAQLALLASTGHAFFPYTPPWFKEIEETEEPEAVIPPGKGISFDVVGRRLRNVKASQAQKAAWQASLISHKYDKRANQYTIMAAADPHQPRTTGVDQDGADYSYFLRAQLGSRAKDMYMLIDTGAGSSWVMGADCRSDACPRHNVFGPADSSTLRPSSDSFTIQYGSGEVRGTLFNDTIKVADMSLAYQLGLASTTSEDFVHFAFDGILGLSMNSGANQNFLQALDDANLLPSNIFCVALNRASDGPNTGEITFGSTNAAMYRGDIGYTPIVQPGSDWAVPLDDMAFRGNKARVGGIRAYIDTGTSYIFGPPDRVKALHDLIPGSHTSDNTTYTVPCDSRDPIAFTFSGVDYPISHLDWVSPKDSSGNCTSNIYGYEAVAGSWLVGDTFLKNVYAVFDKDSKQIGFAPRSPPPSSTSAPPPGSAAETGKTQGPAPTSSPMHSAALSTRIPRMTLLPLLAPLFLALSC